MIKQILKNKTLISIVLLVVFSLSFSNAFAWGGYGHGHYRYHGGRWYSSGWFWGGFAAALTVGTIIATLPPHYEVMYLNGVPYYYYDNAYYRPCPTGYIVVPEPSAAAVVTPPVVAPTIVATPADTQAKAVPGEAVVINIPNASGGYTPVRLAKYKTGYIGQQGEYYEGHPTVEQLRVLYGR